MVAVSGLISFKDAIDVFTKRKRDIPVYVITLFATLLIGVKEGLIAGVIVSAFFNGTSPREESTVH